MMVKYAIRIRLANGEKLYRSMHSSSQFTAWDDAQLWNNPTTTNREVKRLLTGAPYAVRWNGQKNEKVDTTSAEVIMVKIGEPE